MEKNWERFAKMISHRLVINDGPLYPTHMDQSRPSLSHTACVHWFWQLTHLELHEGRVESSLSMCSFFNFDTQMCKFVHTPQITSSKLDLHQGLEGDICIPFLTLSCFVGHYEPAPTSAPSTGWMPVFLLSCGWTSTELVYGFTLVTNSIRNRCLPIYR